MASSSCITIWWSLCSTICSASRLGAGVRARGRMVTGYWRSTLNGRVVFGTRSARAARASNPGWVRVNFNYFISENGLRVHSRRGPLCGGARLEAHVLLILSRPTPGCGGTARAARRRAGVGRRRVCLRDACSSRRDIAPSPNRHSSHISKRPGNWRQRPSVILSTGWNLVFWRRGSRVCAGSHCPVMPQEGVLDRP